MTPEPHTPGEPVDGRAPRTARARFRAFWARHRRLFWMAHSAWALTTGTVIVFLSHEHYGLVRWVGLFLALTWVSTLFFGRAAEARPDCADPADPSFAHEVTSYLTRHLYQDTLFFLLPFYAYSTVLRSPNVVFLVLLGGLAVFSCIDLVFDRCLRTMPLFGLSYFAIVAFAALNLLLPLLVSLPPNFATPVAALLAIAAATPLALRATQGRRGARLRLALGGAVMLLVASRFPELVPPVPLRLEHATFAANIDRRTLALSDTLRSPATSAQAGASMIVLVEVFSPASLPARVRLEWYRDGRLLRLSREVDITAHEGGFRVWDSWRPAGGTMDPGGYSVVLRTADHRVFGVARLTIENMETASVR